MFQPSGATPLTYDFFKQCFPLNIFPIYQETKKFYSNFILK